MKQLLEGTLHHLQPKETASESDFHLGKMREHSKLASHLASMSALHSHEAHSDPDPERRNLHGQLATNYSANSLIHGALKNHYYKLFKTAKGREDAKNLNAGKQDTSNLPANAVRIRAKS